MPKTRKLDDSELKAVWKTLPASDRRFINALAVVNQVVSDGRLRYHELPARLDRTLRACDRDTLFSIIVECLYLLLDAPAMERVKCARRRRQNGTPVRARSRSK